MNVKHIAAAANAIAETINASNHRERGIPVREILEKANKIGLLVENSTELRKDRNGVERPFEVFQISCPRTKYEDGVATLVPAGIRITIPKNVSHVKGAFYKGRPHAVAHITACGENGVIETDAHPGKLLGKKLLMKDDSGRFEEVSIAPNRGGRGIVLVSPVSFKEGDTLFQERGSLVLTANAHEKGELLDSIEFQRTEMAFEGAEGEEPKVKVSHDFLVVSLKDRQTRATTRTKSMVGR